MSRAFMLDMAFGVTYLLPKKLAHCKVSRVIAESE